MTWQPIATAPKDGSWVLGYGNDMSIADYPAVIFWDEQWQAAGGAGVFTVSHWMPLPPPPAMAPTGEPK
jgi:hypothetical protein